ncbi:MULTISPECIES: cation diffusion facilitator family transporter [Protofrankia]|uniref:Cation diffusion facilitator family transporter n=1 Tax=Candidatus Protofrankia datiscae TaxID=2716812 RepID=F8AZ02_9ACTN|nr:MULTISPECIES: cation diffusion facilitator family transporter [Protofrankia]AEH09590.1 cation diffusion facilitator family transporter [Candidatus Protofrankia datiscae]
MAENTGTAHGHGRGSGRHTGHEHDTGHGRDAGHGHDVAADADRRWLMIALGVILAYLVVEVVVGLLAHSLALLSDAAHMLTDAAAIMLALVALRVAARPAGGAYTFGLRRVEILSAQVNGLTLLLLAGWLTVEAIRRLFTPGDVAGGPMLAVALVGVAVNLAAAWAMSRANRTSLNIDGAFQHILSDLYAFVATAAAGVVVLATGWERADTIASLTVVVLMVKAGAGLLYASGRIFLEAAPDGVDPDGIGAAMARRPGVSEVHDLHIWQITSGEPALSAHVLVHPDADCHAVRVGMHAWLREEHHIDHITLQVDHLPTAAHPTAGRPDDPHCAAPHGTTHYAASRAAANPH